MIGHQHLPRIAFLGIGLMGKPMAERILAAGYPLTAWNRTREKAETLTSAGAIAVDTPAAAVAVAKIVVTMLQDGKTVQDVLDAAGSALQPGTLVIDMSSTAQEEAVSLRDGMAGRGVAFLDAPVSGGVIGAQHGELAIMVGGAPEDYGRAEAFLGAMGRPMYVGPSGCGQLAKLCNQLIVGATLTIVAEALMLAQEGGAEPGAVHAAIRSGFAGSRILEVHGPRMLERNFLPGGQIRSQAKDLENVLAAAAAAGLHLPVTELVAQYYRSILDRYPRADQAAAIIALEQINPGHRLGAGTDRLP
jgi:3-hydroxyisobutyrate dehydrogenase-like beta-hydroxyacid dehydrogenase